MSFCLIEEIKKEEYRIVFLDTSDFPSNNYSFLSLEESSQLSIISSPKRKIEFAGVRYLKNHLFGSKENIVYTKDGAPYLKNDSSQQISISHSYIYIGVATAKFRIGLDIELVSEKVARVQDKFLNSFEKNEFVHLSSEELTRIWTMKEVIYKIAQLPGLDYKNNIHIFQKEKRYFGRVRIDNTWFITEFDTFVKDNYIFSYNTKELVQE